MAVLSGCRVLVVEDEALVSMLIADALSTAGATVIGPAASMDRAALLLRQGNVAAAVLDLNIAGEDVTPVAKGLAEIGVPFVVVTGYGFGHRYQIPPAAAVFPKPFNVDDVVQAVARAI